MSAETLLSRLDGVKRSGQGRWLAKCPAHQDKRPSLSIRELDDGRVLVHCFAGCSVHDIVTAAGVELTDLFPEKPIEHGRPERRPFFTADAFRAVGFECMLVALAAARMASGHVLEIEDRDRLKLAHERVQDALRGCGL